MPWKDEDPYSKIIHQYRLAARNAIKAHEDNLDDALVRRLVYVAERVSVELFLPVVYRIDLTDIPDARRMVAGSGLTGSREFLIADLVEEEFDLLFLDDAAGTCLATLMETLPANEALLIMEEQCR